MTATNVRVQMQQRRDTAANWTSTNPTLLNGELGYETDTKKFKIGNGTAVWSALAYVPGFSISAYPLATADIADNAITAAKIADTSVSAGSYTTADITVDAQGRITSAASGTFALPDGSVTTAKLANDAVTGDKLANDITIANNLTVTNDLTVNGTTTTIDSTTLVVEDKNIEIGKVSTPSDTTADGGGITLKGATDKTLTWVDSTDCWTFNQALNLTAGTAGAPALVFNGDVNSGLFQPGADSLAIATGGTQRITVDSSGRLLVGMSSAIGSDGLQNGGSGNAGNGAFYRFDANDSGPFLELNKSRNGTVGSNTLVQSGDELGTINFKGADGTNYKSAARIAAFVDSTPGSNDMPGRLVFSTTADGASSPTERMRLDSSGRVGVGTSSPQNVLSIAASGANPAYLHSVNASSGTGATDGVVIGLGSATDVYYWNYEAGAHIWATSGSEQMRLTGAGNLLIDKTTRDYGGKVEIKFNGSVSNGMAIQTTRDALSSAFLVFVDSDGNTIGSVTQNGATTVHYGTSSDYRLKENVVDLTGAIPRLKTLPVRRFNFIADSETTVDGFLAHEAQLVVPEAVTGTHNEVDADGNPVMQGIDQSKLVPLLTAALQEAIGRIETLETEVAALKAG